MLLRNLDPAEGLCNGTRMIVERISRKVLFCRIISTNIRFAGKKVFIPRIVLQPSAKALPIPLKRQQFPVRLAFAMTINITPEDEKLIQEKLRTGEFHSVEEVIHRALVSLPTPETSPQPARHRRTLVEVLSEPPYAGSELNLERIPWPRRGVEPTGERLDWKVIIWFPWDQEWRLFRGEKVYVSGIEIPERT